MSPPRNHKSRFPGQMNEYYFFQQFALRIAAQNCIGISNRDPHSFICQGNRFLWFLGGDNHHIQCLSFPCNMFRCHGFKSSSESKMSQYFFPHTVRLRFIIQHLPHSVISRFSSPQKTMISNGNAESRYSNNISFNEKVNNYF